MEFQSRYQETICEILDPSQVLEATEKLDSERKAMEQRHVQELSDFDKKIILKLDQQMKDQQSTLERAGVPGTHITEDRISIKVQMHLLHCISKLGAK